MGYPGPLRGPLGEAGCSGLQWAPGRQGQNRRHLLVDALEVHQPGVPELKLDSGQGVQPVQQGLGRVFA